MNNNLLEAFIIEFKAYKKEVSEKLIRIETSLEVLAVELRSMKENCPKDKKSKEKEIIERPPKEINKSAIYETNSPKDYFIKYELPRIIKEEEKYLQQLRKKVTGKEKENKEEIPETSTQNDNHKNDG